MKRILGITIVSMLWLAVGCSSSPSSDRYIKTEVPAINTTQMASNQPIQTKNQQADIQVDTTMVEATQQGEISEVQSPAEKSVQANKPTKSQKLQDAKQSNESLVNAVTDSIMDKSVNQDNMNKPRTVLLKTSIEQIRTLIKQLKQHAENKDTATMREVSLQIVQTWDDMKADVEASYPDMLDFMQSKIDQLDVAQAAEEIDSELMIRLDYELYQAFRQLADKAGI